MSETFSVNFAEGQVTSNLLGFFPVTVKSGSDEQVQHWIEFEARLGDNSEKKHLILLDSLLEEFRRRRGFSVLDDEGFLTQLFATRFGGTTWRAVDLVVRPADMESVFENLRN